jgi:hypothetical protein
LCVRVRIRSAALRGASARNFTWLPAIGFGLVATAAGLGFAPLPAVQTDDKRPVANWAGPAALGAATAVLLVLAGLTGVPLARSLGAASLLMTASVLTPVRPYDGATIRNKTVEIMLVIALLGATTVLLLRVI